MLRMSIHAHPHVRRSGSYFGYAYTYYEIERHLREYQHNGKKLQLDINSPKSKIQLYYGSPPGYFSPNQYKIQMTQWESTLVPPNWVDHSRDYNEWWTANQFGADAFINAGVPAEKVHVYEHGVDASVWTPKKRGKNEVIRFLHVDSGSPRKRADLAIKAFKAAFGNSLDYELTLKHSHYESTKVNWYDKETLENHGDWESGNIRHIKENMGLPELVHLFKFHDVLIYPSEGEGFGLIPLQALATGMPVISTSRWCSYDKYFTENIIESRLGVSDVVENYTRFGNVVLPELDSMISIMKNVVANFDKQSEFFYNQIPKVVSDYNWQHRTNMVMDGLVGRLGANMFTSSKSYLS
jgi:glycosyltransferase involved in cell wall biosynthesis